MPELLRDAGDIGMSAAQIAERTGIQDMRVGTSRRLLYAIDWISSTGLRRNLEHVLRLLATHHIIRETSSSTFALNRLSSAIDTGKPFESLKANPETKYHHTDGIAALVGCL